VAGIANLIRKHPDTSAYVTQIWRRRKRKEKKKKKGGEGRRKGGGEKKEKKKRKEEKKWDTSLILARSALADSVNASAFLFYV
jgi:hypothetical protein